MEISPDQVVLWQAGPFALNATIVFTWVVMAILAVGAHLVTRNSRRPRRRRAGRTCRRRWWWACATRSARSAGPSRDATYPSSAPYTDYRRLRQESITGELLDGVAGFEALSTREDTGTDAEGGASAG